MSAFYNEHDPKAAAWLRELIKAGLIAPGIVDERSITDISPTDLNGFTQCHFFAGIGGWSYALRLAGVPDSLPVWTGSCPCQPFSAAGKQKGMQDDRHLWPSFARLIDFCRPATIFGEQVASKDGRTWLAGVFADLEGMGYSRAAADLCAAGVGAPHIRQRLYWVADADEGKRGGIADRQGGECDGQAAGREQGDGELESSGAAGGMADTDGGDAGAEREQRGGKQRLLAEGGGVVGLEHATSDGREQRGTRADWWGLASGCGVSGLANDGRGRREMEDKFSSSSSEACGVGKTGISGVHSDVVGLAHHHHQGSQRRGSEQLCKCEVQQSPWASSDIIQCLDGKQRRIEPGSFPLAHGVPGRVGLLRGYGNAIVPPLAAEFIAATYEAINENLHRL